jgi:hypothetical protein
VRVIRFLFWRTGRAGPWDLFRAMFWTLVACVTVGAVVGFNPLLVFDCCLGVGACVFGFLFAANSTAMRSR